jgi:hypothetical protein
MHQQQDILGQKNVTMLSRMVPFLSGSCLIDVTYAISQFYYPPCMREDMAAYIKSCPTCQRMKAKPQSAPTMRPLAAPSRPFKFITLDWLGGFR